MKRYFLIALTVAFLAIPALAQGGTGYFAILPGYQFSSSEVESCFVGSLDGGYFYNDNWGLHMGLNYNAGEFDFNDFGLGHLPYSWVDDVYKDSFYIFEIGPELAGNVGPGQLYGQLNIGHTFGAEENEWTYGVACGYRFPINDRVGINVQGTYHRVNDWDTDHLDLRLGVIFRF